MTMKLRKITLVLGILVAASGVASTFLPTTNEIEQWTPPEKQQFAWFGERLLKSLPANEQSLRIDDMVFTIEDTQAKSAFYLTADLWPGGVVYYEFADDVNMTQRDMWRDAAREWSRVADLEFIESTDERDYVYVEPGDGNWTYVGYGRGKREMCIHDWLPRVMMHEIGHVLGLIHEHQRSDRDEYLRIDWDNVQEDCAADLQIEETDNYGPYDFGSIMHYESSVCPKKNGDTLVPLPGYEQWLHVMGKSDSLSYYDREGMASRYGPGPQSGDDEYEPNNRDFIAYDLSRYENAWLSSISGEGILNDPDFYRIQAGPEAVKLTVECFFPSTELADIAPELVIYGPKGRRDDCTAVKRPNSCKVTFVVKAGEVSFVEVAGPQDHIAYDLRWTQRPYVSGDNVPFSCPGVVGSSRSPDLSLNRLGDLLLLLSSAVMLLGYRRFNPIQEAAAGGCPEWH
jgi:hypothetical protein